MNKINDVKMLVHSTIRRVILIVFPPIGEESILQFDIRIGLITEENPSMLCVIGTSIEDLWSPVFIIEQVPASCYQESDFVSRTDTWMKDLNDVDDITYEYFDFSESVSFNQIVGQQISSVELLFIEDFGDPFGVRIVFPHDYILSVPNSDGNTVITERFNYHDVTKHFRKLGAIVSRKL